VARQSAIDRIAIRHRIDIGRNRIEEARRIAVA
jgi:hypothetical protein